MSRTATTTISAPDRAAPARRLRQFLALDAVVTGSNGLGYLLLAGPLESLLGVSADLLRPIGAFLLAFGVLLAVVALRSNISRVATVSIIAGNALWTIVSLLALVTGSLTPTVLGGIWVATQAVVVAGFATAQAWALRRCVDATRSRSRSRPGCANVSAMSSSVEPEIYFEDLTPGRTFDLGRLVVDEAEMIAFAQRFDPQWYHVDRARAQTSRWGGLIASGFFTVSALMRMYVDNVLSRAAADTSPGMENLRWFAPVYAGDELAALLTVTDAQPSSRSAELGTVFLQWQMHRGTELVLQMNGRGWFVRREP